MSHRKREKSKQYLASPTGRSGLVGGSPLQNQDLIIMKKTQSKVGSPDLLADFKAVISSTTDCISYQNFMMSWNNVIENI